MTAALILGAAAVALFAWLIALDVRDWWLGRGERADFNLWESELAWRERGEEQPHR